MCSGVLQPWVWDWDGDRQSWLSVHATLILSRGTDAVLRAASHHTLLCCICSVFSEESGAGSLTEQEALDVLRVERNSSLYQAYFHSKASGSQQVSAQL